MADGSSHSFVKCEAVKVAYRQTKEGMVIHFAIHPNDMPPELALAPVGTRVLLAVAEITDEQQAQTSAPEPAPARSNPNRSEQAKDAYRNAAPMKQAATRAAMVCKDRRFQQWIATIIPEIRDFPPGVSEETRAAIRLKRWLGIESRGDIGDDADAYRRFSALETEWKIYTGELPSPR